MTVERSETSYFDAETKPDIPMLEPERFKCNSTRTEKHARIIYLYICTCILVESFVRKFSVVL